MIQKENVPECIGIIMDGNRRWAEANGLKRHEGHHEGYKKLKEVVAWAQEYGVRHVIVYALSTENWKRSEKEISVLLNLLRKMVADLLETLKKENVRVRFAGQISRFPEDIQKNMRIVEEETSKGTGPELVVLVSYGGRAEIVEAAKKACLRAPHKQVAEKEEAINEETLESHMWLSGVPAPDIVVRTGGEKRLSNFLLWHVAYSELYFTDTLWPALTKEEFTNIITEYALRNRRYGS